MRSVTEVEKVLIATGKVAVTIRLGAFPAVVPGAGDVAVFVVLVDHLDALTHIYNRNSQSARPKYQPVVPTRAPNGKWRESPIDGTGIEEVVTARGWMRLAVSVSELPQTGAR